MGKEGKRAGPAKRDIATGRPPIDPDVEELILRLARETDWGYSKIRGELMKLGIVVARNTIKKVMLKNGITPGPERSKGDWDVSSDAI